MNRDNTNQESEMKSFIEFDSDPSSPWLDAQAHYEALTDYVNELPSLFAHHSTQMRLRKKHFERKFLHDPALSEEDKEIVRFEHSEAVEVYENQLRQIIYSPAITAVISCFEHYMRTAYKICCEDRKFCGIKTARREIDNKYPEISQLYPIDLAYMLTARHIISHLNGWICDFEFTEPCKDHFLKWARSKHFLTTELDVLVADDLSVNHCFKSLESFFISLPVIVK